MTSKTQKQTRPPRRFSPALVISCIALFVALSATAAALPGSNSVRSDDIVNGQVKRGDLRDNAVNTAKLADDAVTTAELADDAVTTAEVAADTLAAGDLATDSVTATEIAPNAVGTSEVAPDSLGAADLAPNSVGSSEIAPGSVGASELGDNIHEHTASGNAVDPTALDGDWDETAVITATCGAGEELIGVASTWTSGGDELSTQQLNPDFANESVAGIGISDDGGTAAFQVTAVCSF